MKSVKKKRCAVEVFESDEDDEMELFDLEEEDEDGESTGEENVDPNISKKGKKTAQRESSGQGTSRRLNRIRT